MTTQMQQKQQGQHKQQGQQQGQEQHKQGQSDERSVAEWVTLGASALLIASLLGLIAWAYFTGEQRVAIIEANPQLGEVRQVGEGYYIPVEITNTGGKTVESVTVTVALTLPDGQTQTADIPVTFLAGGETVTGTVVFMTDPSQGEVSIDSISYIHP